MTELKPRPLQYVGGYFGVLTIFWAVSTVLWSAWGYEKTFLVLNEFHHPFHDQASLYFLTHLADGVILPAILLLWMWRKDPALAITAVLAVFATGILTQIGKQVIFPEWHRPARVFENQDVFIFMPNPPKAHSFPSGHATSFATGGLFFAYFLSQIKTYWGILVGIFTIFLCYTRVTLGVHFPGDIFVGSMIGSLGAFGMLKQVYPRFQHLVERKGHARWMKATPYVFGFAVIGLIAQFIHLISRIG